MLSKLYVPPSIETLRERIEQYKTEEEIQKEEVERQRKLLEDQERLRQENLQRQANERLLHSFKLILNCLNSIHPGKCNRTEWSAIRSTSNHILGYVTVANIENGLIELLNCLSGIYPRMCNRGQWQQIRIVCSNVRNALSSTHDVRGVLISLLNCFRVIFPRRCNRSEWNVIRQTAVTCVSHL